MSQQGSGASAARRPVATQAEQLGQLQLVRGKRVLGLSERLRAHPLLSGLAARNEADSRVAAVLPSHFLAFEAALEVHPSIQPPEDAGLPQPGPQRKRPLSNGPHGQHVHNQLAEGKEEPEVEG